MALLWGGYTLAIWGYTRLKGYDIGLSQLVVPGRYTATWPPPLIDDEAGAKKTPGPSGSVGGPSHNGVPPGSHPGDMPWSYPSDPSAVAAGARGMGGVMQT